MSSPNISALAAYAGKNEQKLFSTLFNKFDALNDLTLFQDIKVATQMTKLKAGKGARPGSKTFQSSGQDLVYSGTTLTPTWGKRDLSISPTDYNSTWMAEIKSRGVNPKEIPFAAYVWNQVMIELAAELNDNTIYFGFDKADASAYSSGSTYAVGDYITFDTPSTGLSDYYKCLAITTTGQSPVTHPAKWQMVNAEAICIGFGKRISDGVDNGDTTPVSTGAVDNTDAYAQFTEMFRSMPVAYRKSGICIFASFNSTDALADDFENKVTKYTEVDQATGKIYLSKTSRMCEIVPATWMGESGRLIATPKSNLVIGTDAVSDLNKIVTLEGLRQIDAAIDYSLGTVVRDWEAIRVNDQE
jgi:hypothetical protein